jgi:hypothetical protein
MLIIIYYFCFVSSLLTSSRNDNFLRSLSQWVHSIGSSNKYIFRAGVGDILVLTV